MATVASDQIPVKVKYKCSKTYKPNAVLNCAGVPKKYR